MRQAVQFPPAFLRRLAVVLLTAMLFSLAGCLGVPGTQDGQETQKETAPPQEILVEPEEPALEVGAEPAPEETPTGLDASLYDEFVASRMNESQAAIYCYTEPLASQDYLMRDEYGRPLSLKNGTVVLRLEEQGPMMRVLWESRQVWVLSWYLTARDPELENERFEARLEELCAQPGFERFDEPDTCYTTASGLNCREMPNVNAMSYDVAIMGTQVTAYGRIGDFCLVRLPNGRLCYCSLNYVASNVLCVKCPGAVDLRALMPRAQFELLFASANNITGQALYPAFPLLEEHTASLLYEAYQRFLEDGYLLKIYDAYRPLSAQFALYEIVQDSRFIADPNNWGSWHQRGRAVDISLVDLETGEELEMPTPMHTFDMSASRTRSSRWTEEARKNVKYMTDVMQSFGFGIIDTEWWHFEYTAQGYMMPVELDYNSLEVCELADYFL